MSKTGDMRTFSTSWTLSPLLLPYEAGKCYCVRKYARQHSRSWVWIASLSTLSTVFIFFLHMTANDGTVHSFTKVCSSCSPCCRCCLIITVRVFSLSIDEQRGHLHSRVPQLWSEKKKCHSASALSSSLLGRVFCKRQASRCLRAYHRLPRAKH